MLLLLCCQHDCDYSVYDAVKGSFLKGFKDSREHLQRIPYSGISVFSDSSTLLSSPKGPAVPELVPRHRKSHWSSCGEPGGYFPGTGQMERANNGMAEYANNIK